MSNSSKLWDLHEPPYVQDCITKFGNREVSRNIKLAKGRYVIICQQASLPTLEPIPR